MSHDRTLRVLTLLTTALATPLLIGATVLSLQPESWYRRRVSAFCFGYIPLALTAAASVIGIARHGKTPKISIALLDLVAAVTYVALLIPIWSIEVPRLNQGGVGLLIGYTTAPMIVNMFFHIYAFLWNVKFVCSALLDKTEHECPNCRSRFVAGAPEVQETSKGGERYSLLRGEEYLDEDAVAYVDARVSEEQVGAKGAADIEEDKGKGAIKL
ncbi:hypothetical protein HBI56_049720 [Parastagonospora nodorum]|nr:hypothetical protein HBH50_040590 [Parastagonospora nodorum]KAH4091478.1 hypothetical protein HBH48_092910 [Parastagonospora nodorum]KAH4194019.1 hypothetical protein HBH42_091460 [Parastagonospora nodorum]KAH4303111.1 hypothetical protein HBI01_086370 [Parastagonospora nodorum]KAH4318378.1 hypothetical protein HBI02_009070 [Parastagonospora nodorum]